MADLTSSDVSELALEHEGKAVLKFGRSYGFRNIQSIINILKRGKNDFDLIEVMACPSGCINGGGQLRGELVRHGESKVSENAIGTEMIRETPADVRRRVEAVDRAFHSVLQLRRPQDSELAKYLYSESLLGSPNSEKAIGLLHTRYHAVPKLELVAPMATKW